MSPRGARQRTGARVQVRALACRRAPPCRQAGMVARCSRRWALRPRRHPPDERCRRPLRRQDWIRHPRWAHCLPGPLRRPPRAEACARGPTPDRSHHRRPRLASRHPRRSSTPQPPANPGRCKLHETAAPAPCRTESNERAGASRIAYGLQPDGGNRGGSPQRHANPLKLPDNVTLGLPRSPPGSDALGATRSYDRQVKKDEGARRRRGSGNFFVDWIRADVDPGRKRAPELTSRGPPTPRRDATRQGPVGERIAKAQTGVECRRRRARTEG